MHGIIKHVYVPYTVGSSWTLSGTNDKTNKIYEEYYKKIRLREKLESIATEYWKYANVWMAAKRCAKPVRSFGLRA